MSKVNLEYLILEVLEKEVKDANGFLTPGEIAYRCNGLCYEKGIMRKSPIVPYSVKIRMANTRQTALNMGIVITCKRVKHIKKKESRSNEVYGWKIADKNDHQYIIEDMEIRRLMSNGNRLSIQNIAETARMKGLIAPEDIPALLELGE